MSASMEASVEASVEASIEASVETSVETSVEASIEASAETTPHQFWNQQPVSVGGKASGPIRELIPDKTPAVLPAGYVWAESTIDQLDEIHDFLLDHYVGDESFGLAYTRPVLKFWLQDAIKVAIRDTDGKLIGFVTAGICPVVLDSRPINSGCVDFLCVHSAHRGARLAPILITEVCRRLNLQGVYQAIYTVAKPIPGNFSMAAFFHRPLQPDNLIAKGFYDLPPNADTRKFAKMNALPKKIRSTGLFVLQESDIPEARRFLQAGLSRFRLHETDISLDRFRSIPHEYHALGHRDGDGHINGVAMLHRLDLNSRKTGKRIHQCMLQYFITDETRRDQIMEKIIAFARDRNYDLLTAVSTADTYKCFAKFGFQPGTGRLHYYMYNWHMPVLNPVEIAVNLL